MKKVINIILAIAAGAMILSSCQKETDGIKATHKVTFKAVVDETKTVLDGDHANWVDTDAALFHVFEDGVEATDQNVTFTDGVATIEAIFTGEESSDHTYTAYVGNANTSGKAQVLSTQTPTTSSYDPNADILIAKAITTTGESAFDGLEFQFKRVVSVNKMTIKGIQDGETISKVTLEGNYAIIKSYDSEGNATNVSKLLTINTNSTEVYFVTSAANAITINATVTTDKAVYTKSIPSITFSENAYKPFSVTFTNRQTADASYGMISKVSDLSEGDVIVLGCPSLLKAAGSLSSAYLSSVDATIQDYVLKSANAVEFTLGKDDTYWTLTSESGLLGAIAARKLSYTSTTEGFDSKWNITIANNGEATISSNNSTYGKIGYNSTTPRFLNYTSDQTPIAIYKKGYIPTSYSITVDSSVEHGTVSANLSSAIEGQSVSLSAVAEDGYMFSEWIVKDADDNTITVTKNSFVMPASNVSVSASFVEKGETTNVVFDFTAIDGFTEWTTSYIQHVVEYENVATVTFSSANRSTVTITTVPVTKGSAVKVVMAEGKTIKTLKLTCLQWGTKAQTITLYTSTDGGETFSATDSQSTNFVLSASNLNNINAVEFRFSSSANQVGIQSLEIDYAE